jgi:Uma2 family endonuclease
MSSVALHAGTELPDIDDRLVEPETRYEMYDGELVEVSPADRPHASRHVQLAALIEAHIGHDFEAGADLLTRTSPIDDVAPDVSVYPDAPDPTTDRRQLEQLAFEIVSTQSLAHAGRKAAKLAGRGVRRVFAIDVERSRALEWSAALGTWRELDPAGHIEDPALEVPLPIHDMIHAAKADDAVQRALIAKGNPVLEAHVAKHREEAKAEGRAEGLTRGKAEALLAVLAARGIAVGDAERMQILGEQDPRQLDRWLAGAATCAAATELFTMRR